jgi:predicted permease
LLSASGQNDLESPNRDWLRVIGRLGAGMTLAQAQNALATALNGLSPEVKPVDSKRLSTPRPLQAAALASDAREGVVRFIAIVAGVVVLVLLTACANIAGLLLSRAAYREREVALRMALGAGRGRLLRQLLTEALVLAAAGGAAGVVLFVGVRAALERVSLPGGITGSVLGLTLDARLVVFAITLTVITGLLVGLVPAIQASRPDPSTALKGASSRRGSRPHFMRSALVTAQVAVGLVLLIGTGLFARALSRAFSVDLGFDTEQLITMSVDPGLARLQPERARAYFEDVTRRVAAVPGVSGVSWTGGAPLSDGLDRESARIDGYTPAPRERVMLEFNAVGPRFHDVMGIPLRAGRSFDERDALDAPPVIVVNETMAKRYFAGRSAVGAYATLFGVRMQIIGVARDIKYHQLNESPRPYVYLPMLQLPPRNDLGTPTLVVRTPNRASALLPSVVEAVRSANASVPVFEVATMADRVRYVLAPQLAGTWLLGGFSALALVVAAVGIYGVVAYAVSQRTREIGIRMALGARRSSVIGLVIARNLAFVLAGIIAGILLAIPLARVMTSFLYGVGTTDLITLASTSVTMLLVALVASFIP